MNSPQDSLLLSDSAPQKETVPEAASFLLAEDELILIPVRDFILFPGLIAPLAINRASSIAAAQSAARNARKVGILLQRDVQLDELTAEGLYSIGTVATVLRYITTRNGTHNIVCHGEQRFRVIEFSKTSPYLVAKVELLDEKEENTPEIEAHMLQVRTHMRELISLMPQLPEDLGEAITQMTSPSMLADFVASLLDLKIEEKQDLLETLDLRTRLNKILQTLAARLEVLRLSKEIGEQTQERLQERQREALLREQLKTIQTKLGESDSNAQEIALLGEAIDKAKMPDEVEAHVKKELKRLQHMAEESTEYSMLRTYLEYMVELPWAADAAENIDITQARATLDADHYGLEKIKRRILEHLAVRKLNPNGKSPILCFVGPPGVGKTSLGQSIAKALGLKFARVSLGGVHDEVEIRGHRRTYIGAMPGNVIQALRKAGMRNCVMMLDEIDKLGTGVHGDPAAALLEVLDPEQNSSFRDNYLGVPFDLSNIMFIATANVLERIPGPLLDRMEVISLPGYTQEEKMQIARRYLIERQLAATGLTSAQCTISDEALRSVISDYTREAGVRNLEREIGNLCRNVAMQIAEGSQTQIVIDTQADVELILGAPRYEGEVAMRTSIPGVATGLAWTPVGGDILFIEASRAPGNGKLILTGQLGEVMKESAQAALTLLKARAERFGIELVGFEKNDIHIHVPAGATPKDGPSAGVAMFMALASLMSNRTVRSDCAMTGEISLRGLVLPVGGIKEKVLAALRAGIKTVLLPKRNQKDLEDIPPDAKQQLEFVWLESVDDAMQAAMNRPTQLGL